MIKQDVCKNVETLEIENVQIQFSYDKNNQDCNIYIKCSYKHAYGMGEKFDFIDQKGHICINQVEEKFCNQGEKTYCSVPFFVYSIQSF